MNMAQNEPKSRVVLMDLVLPIGSIASIVGYQGSSNLVSLAKMSPDEWAAEVSPDAPAGTGKWNFHMVAGASDPDSAAQLRVDKIGGILEQLKASYDYVVLDLGRSLSKFSLQLLPRARPHRADRQHRPEQRHPDQNAAGLPALEEREGPHSVHHPEPRRRLGGPRSRADVEQALGIEIKTTFPYLVHFTLANNQHQPFTLKYPTDTTVVIAFQEVAGTIVEAAYRSREVRLPVRGLARQGVQYLPTLL